MEGKLQPLPPPENGGVPAREPLVDLVIDGTEYATTVTRKFARRRPWQPIDPHRVTAAIPGLILRVAVKVGDRVRRGQPLLVLEAMKMQNDVAAPRDGVIAAVRVQPGQKVAKGELMIELRD